MLISKYDYPSLRRIQTKQGRQYVGEDNNPVPSVTTILGDTGDKTALIAWRKRVGEEEANKISHRAATRGTAVHAIVEDYINNKENYTEGYMPNVIENFKDIKGILDERIGKVYAQEVPLYSEYLELAGRVDCVAEFDGVLSIVDFKTSRKLKKKEWIENYFIQESAYAIMWEERTGVPITNIVTIISVDGEPAQVFKEHRDNWAPKLLDTINEYKTRKMFGH